MTAAHQRDVRSLVAHQYQHARIAFPHLPLVDIFPDPLSINAMGFGIVAEAYGATKGYLVGHHYANFFGSTGARGIHVPLEGLGVSEGETAKTIGLLYQDAAHQWVTAGILNHCLTIYANQTEERDVLYQLGFGLRLADAYRSLHDHSGLPVAQDDEIEFTEHKISVRRIYPLYLALVDHLRQSPMFMVRDNTLSEDDFVESAMRQRARYFIARKRIGGDIIAYMKLIETGENFITTAASMRSISGAYCLPEYRGTGLASKLLSFVCHQLEDEGFAQLGVDYETFNPQAWGFWSKYFQAYTYGLTRHIDDQALQLLSQDDEFQDRR